MFKEYIKYKKIYESRDTHRKKKRNVWARYYLDEFKFESRVDFFLRFLDKLLNNNFILEIKYWDNNDYLLLLLNEFNKTYKVLREYSGDQVPGVIIIDEKKLDFKFFKSFLQSHFNHDLALEPSINIQLLLFFKDNEKLNILNFYDDRGFIVNHYFL